MPSPRLAGFTASRSWPSQRDRARCRHDEAGDHLQRRRLAAARRPEQRHELALLHGQRQLLDGRVLAKALVRPSRTRNVMGSWLLCVASDPLSPSRGAARLRAHASMPPRPARTRGERTRFTAPPRGSSAWSSPRATLLIATQSGTSTLAARSPTGAISSSAMLTSTFLLTGPLPISLASAVCTSAETISLMNSCTSGLMFVLGDRTGRGQQDRRAFLRVDEVDREARYWRTPARGPCPTLRSRLARLEQLRHLARATARRRARWD